jgi:TldD protein
MTNINIDPGQDGSREDILRNTQRGILLDGERSWSIGSNREQFHFGTEIGWLVEDGQVTRVVKNSTYKGDTVKFWNSLSAVGDQSTWSWNTWTIVAKASPTRSCSWGTASRFAVSTTSP